MCARGGDVVFAAAGLVLDRRDRFEHSRAVGIDDLDLPDLMRIGRRAVPSEQGAEMNVRILLCSAAWKRHV